MLGKLIKFEWKDTYLVGTISSIVVLVLAAIGAIVFHTNIWEIKFQSAAAESLMATMVGFYFFMYIFSIIAIIFVMRYYFFWRYYKNLFTDHGYLMNTLPVTGTQLINAKLLIALIWQYITWIVVYIAIMALFFGFLSGLGDFTFSQFWDALSEIPNDLAREMRDAAPFMISMMCIVLISPIMEILIMYAAVGIGQGCKKHKFLISVLILIGLYMLRSFVLQIFMIPFNYALMDNIDSLWAVNIAGILLLLVVVGIIVGLWFLNKYFIESKLNLE